MLKIPVNLKKTENRSYNVLIGRNTLKNAGKEIKRLKLGSNIFIITDTVVDKLYSKKVISAFKAAGFKDVGKAVIPSGENSKSLANFINLQNALYNFDKHQDKKVVVVTLGGGVPGDLGGFVAGTYKRGVNYIQIPTTLLGQVDCGLGVSGPGAHAAVKSAKRQSPNSSQTRCACATE